MERIRLDQPFPTQGFLKKTAGAKALNWLSSSPLSFNKILTGISVLFLNHAKKFKNIMGAPVCDASWLINKTFLADNRFPFH
jgi:hypothetical protein